MNRWAIAALMLALGALLGAECGRRGRGEEQHRVVVVDTLVHRRLQVRDSVVVRYDTVRLAVAAAEGGESDTATVKVPITQAHYATAEAEAWVSGFRPRLDSLRVYTPRLVAPAPARPKRWHVGITAGAALTPRGVEPSVTVGITYSFYSF